MKDKKEGLRVRVTSRAKTAAFPAVTKHFPLSTGEVARRISKSPVANSISKVIMEIAYERRSSGSSWRVLGWCLAQGTLLSKQGEKRGLFSGNFHPARKLCLI